MKDNLAKIRAELESIRSCDDMEGERDAALAALAELEKSAPQFVAGEVDDAMAMRACARIFGSNVGDGYAKPARDWLSAWRAELGPALGLVDIREPTPEECADMAEWFKSECAACCINPQESADYGRAIFDAVKIVMWPKEGL